MTDYQLAIIMESRQLLGNEGMHLAITAVERGDNRALDILDHVLSNRHQRYMESVFDDDVMYEGIRDMAGKAKDWAVDKSNAGLDALQKKNRDLSRKAAKFTTSARYMTAKSKEGLSLGKAFTTYKKHVNNIETAIVGGEVTALGFLLPKPVDFIAQTKLVNDSKNPNIIAARNKVKKLQSDVGRLVSKIKNKEIDDRAAISQARRYTIQMANIGNEINKAE